MRSSIVGLLLSLSLLAPVVAQARGSGSVSVRGYYRKDGTYVRPHTRSRADGYSYNNTDYRGLGINQEGEIKPGADLRSAKLAGKTLTKLNLSRTNLAGVDLSKADLGEANLDDADLTGANLTDAKLRSATLNGARLTGARLSGTDLTDARADRVRLERGTLIAAILEDADLAQADLTGANLTGANLDGADLTGAKLAQTTLTDADLEGAILVNADLTGAVLTGATLKDATYSAQTRWPDGFDPQAAGAKLVEVAMAPPEAAAVPPKAAAAPPEAAGLADQIRAALEKNDLAGAERAAEQLRSALAQARERAAVMETRAAKSPQRLDVGGGVTATFSFPTGLTYLFNDEPAFDDPSCSGRIYVDIPDALAVDNRLFKVSGQMLEARFSSSDRSVARIDEYGRIKLVGKGTAQLAVQLGSARLQIPVEVKVLPVGFAVRKAGLVEALGFPDQVDGLYWRWNAYPGLSIRVSDIKASLETDWGESVLKVFREHQDRSLGAK